MVAKELFLIDGSAFAYRSFFAIRGLTNSKGQPTNAVFGFARVLLKILREHVPSHVAVVFDAPGKTFRDDLYKDYKANRPETPAELISQMPLIDDLLGALNIPVIRIEGVEADDVIGALARRGEAESLDVVLVTGDKDALQLVTGHVKVYDPYKGDGGYWYGPEEVRARYGVPPESVVDVLALMGDSADNVPGVKGIGEKTARKLLEQYGSLDAIYEHLDELKGKQRERLEADRDLAFLSRELVTIDTSASFGDVSLDACIRREYDAERLLEVLSRLEFQSLVSEFLPSPDVSEETDYQLVLSIEALERLVARLREAGTFALDTETTSADPMRAELVGISVSCQEGEGFYIPVGHTAEAMTGEKGPDELFAGSPIEGIPRETVLDTLRPLLTDPSVGKVGHNIKYDLIVLERAGVSLRGIVMDTMVASYLTDPSRLRHNLSEVCLHYLKRRMIPIAELIGTGAKTVTFDKVPVERACAYSCEDADVCWRLAGVFRRLLRERGVEDLLFEMELPLVPVLARMEMRGFAINPAVFEELQHEIEQRLSGLEGDIYNLAGERFQVNSPKQLQEILFSKLKLKPRRRTKTGFSTDMSVLEELAQEHPLPERILEYRMLEKLRGTYVEALPKLVHPETGRIHTSFNQAVAATGRLSSSDPNLQNIPVRTEIGRRIRQGFVPGSEGWLLVSADYSQVELRILAHLSGDLYLKEAFEKDLDIHRATAARVFGVSPGDVSSEMRRQAKAINFGVVYGISPFGLAKSLGSSTSDAAHFIEQYFKMYPGVQAWINATLKEAKAKGYVTTMLKRRRYLPEIKSNDANVRRAAERVAING